MQSKRLVHRRDERCAGSERARFGKGPERKPIEDHRTAGRHRGQYRQRGRALRDAREWKAVAYVGNIDVPTEPPKLLDDASIIAITSGRRGEITRHGERKVQFIACKRAHGADPAMVAPSQTDLREPQAEQYASS